MAIEKLPFYEEREVDQRFSQPHHIHDQFPLWIKNAEAESKLRKGWETLPRFKVDLLPGNRLSENGSS